jgi:hypothetical protein
MDPVELENRFAFHPAATQDRREQHEQVRAQCLTLAVALNLLVPEGREKALAMTHLEGVMMWSNAAIARQSD